MAGVRKGEVVGNSHKPQRGRAEAAAGKEAGAGARMRGEGSTETRAQMAQTEIVSLDFVPQNSRVSRGREEGREGIKKREMLSGSFGVLHSCERGTRDLRPRR